MMSNEYNNLYIKWVEMDVKIFRYMSFHIYFPKCLEYWKTQKLTEVQWILDVLVGALLPFVYDEESLSPIFPATVVLIKLTFEPVSRSASGFD